MSATDLITTELTLTGRIRTASNATFVGTIGEVSVVYKPIAGEAPLWDFPDGTLANREVAAYLVSQALGWDVVPRTWLRDGPFGHGMVQVWQEPDPDLSAVDLVETDQAPESGWKHVLEGRDEDGRSVTLIHEDSSALRRMAVFDLIVNNADRKGNHILAMTDGHRFGVDHGLTFHTEHKVRTVLWGWLDETLGGDELDGVERVGAGLRGELRKDLAGLVSAEEIEALGVRCARLRETRQFPTPAGQVPAVPWPLF